jgi:large subunit ribosomal protein L22
MGHARQSGYTYQKWEEPDGTVHTTWDDLSEEGRAKYARAVAKDCDISWKASREISATMRGWPLADAIEYMKAVQRKGLSPEDQVHKKLGMGEVFHVPYRHFAKQVTHRQRKVFKGPSGEAHVIAGSAGRYPRLAAKEFQRALEYAQAYAVERDLNADYMRLVHVASHMGRPVKSMMPRAHGRATPKRRHRIHIEVVVREDEQLEQAAEAEDGQRED